MRFVNCICGGKRPCGIRVGAAVACEGPFVLRTGLVISEVAGQTVKGLSYQEVTDVIAKHPQRPLTMKFWADDGSDPQIMTHVPGHMVRYLNSPSAYE